MASPQVSNDSLLVQSASSILSSSSSTCSPTSNRPLTPAQAQMVLKAANHWRGQHENKINSKISLIRDAKRNRDVQAESEVDALVARRVPFDILANDWLKNNNVSIEQRAYLLEKLVPTLVLAVEKLLIVAEKKGLIDTEKPSKEFNPINYLAQYLMRNNPRYSNFAEASPYARSVRKLLEDLKKDAFNQDENRLAKMKLQAKKRRHDREKVEESNFSFGRGRAEALQDLFVQWTEDKDGAIFLHLVQSALRSFADYMANPADEASNQALYAKRIGETDMTGKKLAMKEFVQMVLGAIVDFSDDAFTEFIRYMSRLAAEYRVSEYLESVRLILANLFLACDHGDTGLLDRKRVLKLLEAFYDNTTDESFKSSLRNPRKWPVIHIDEQEEAVDELRDEEFYGSHGVFKESDVLSTKDLSNQADNIRSIGDENEGKFESGTFKKQDSAPAKKIEKNDDNDSAMNETEKVEEEVEEPEEAKEAKEKVASTSVDAEKSPDNNAMESSESSAKVSRAHSVATGSMFDPATLNQAQFINVLAKFLGDRPDSTAVEALVRYVRAGYFETEEERIARLEKARLEARSANRLLKLDHLFDLWDIDGSGYLEVSEVETVISKWREDESTNLRKASKVFDEIHGKINRKSFKNYVQQIIDMCSGEESFDSLVSFLFARVERSFEERKRGEFRKKLLATIHNSANTSGALHEPVFKAVYQAISKDAEVHGRNKKTSAYIAFLEPNEQSQSKHSGSNCLRYVSCTPDDSQYILNKVLYRDMKNVSFTVVDSGKPIHVPRVLHSGEVNLWNPIRKEENIEGSLVMLPLLNHERQVIGVFGVDTLPDPHDKSVFVTHEISFYQGLAKALSSAIQLIDTRRKTIKIAESAVSWILQRSQNVKEVDIYQVEPGLKTSDGLILRKMLTLRQNNNITGYQNPPRLERKDNLFRDYLFKCIDTSETLTADAYGERHIAFPLRDGDGMAVAILDISIGDQLQLPSHENKEVHRILKLLAMAHKEVARETAGEEKNIVLKVEQEHQEKRIEVLFDRIMLQDLRENVVRLDARAFAEIKSYKDPPKLVHDIVKAVLEIYFGGKESNETATNLDEWTNCKQFVNAELMNWMSTFDPTASLNLAIAGEKLAANLSSLPAGAVVKQGSLPAQYFFNWAFVCLSLIEHTAKMRDNRPIKEIPQDSTGSVDSQMNLAVEL